MVICNEIFFLSKWESKIPSSTTGRLLNITSKNLSTSLSTALYSGDKASVIILTATGVCVKTSGLSALCLDSGVYVCLNERERKKVNG